MRSTAFVTSGTSPKNPSSSSRSGSSRAAQRRWGSSTYGFVGSITAASGGLLEEIVRVVDQVLVERVVLGDEDRERVAVPSPGASRLLPHRRAGSRVAGEHRGVERADVDPELQRARRGDREEVAVGELAFDLPPVLGEVACSVALDARAGLRLGHVPPGELGEQLGGAPRPREPDRANVAVGEPAHEPRRLAQRAAPLPGVLVDDRRVPEREELLAARRPIVGDLLEGQAGEPRRELARVADGGATPGTSAGCRRSGRPGAGAAAAPSPRASRTRRGTRAPRRPPPCDRRKKKSAHRAWSGRSDRWSMSGFVITRFAFLRISGRSAWGVSPS